MQWYFSSFVIHRQVRKGAFLAEFREYYHIMKAATSYAAYEKSLSIAAKELDTLNLARSVEWILDGVSELLQVDEPPASGSELAWSEQEFSADELDAWMGKEPEFEAKTDLTPPSGWFVAQIVMREVHDSGSHDHSILTWTEQFLIRAQDRHSARALASDLGSNQESKPGSHFCNEDLAHWMFQGIRRLINTVEPPYDGAMLWFDESSIPLADLRMLVPPRLDLGVFKWEARKS